jgi:hypothetical protein
MPKKVFVKPRTKEPKKYDDKGRDHVLLKNVTQVVCRASKKIKAFEAQRLTRILKKGNILDAATKDTDSIGDTRVTSDLYRVRHLDIQALVLPRALKKLGLDSLLVAGVVTDEIASCDGNEEKTSPDECKEATKIDSDTEVSEIEKLHAALAFWL